MTSETNKKNMPFYYRYKPTGRKSYVFYGLGMIGLAVVIGLVMILILQRDLPSPAQLHNIQPSLITRIYDRNGETLMEYYIERRILIPYDQIPPYLVDCLLATEDRKFFDHWGVDTRRIVGAAIHNVMKFDLTAEGASTITQQLARSLFLTPEKKLVRKIKEALTAIKIERTYSKNEILQMYLNNSYFGPGAYGIQAASQLYFSKDAKDLDLSECAILIGLLKAPSRYSPIDHPDRATKRRNIVLNSLVDYGKISEEISDSLQNLPLEIHPNEGKPGIAPYFTELVRQQILNKYGEEALYSSGLSIHTTLDLELQREAEKALMEELDKRQAELEKYYDPDDENYTIPVPDTLGGPDSIRVYKELQGMLLAMDNETGAVLAFIGGKDFKTSKFNRVVQAYRQPGSAFKPFVYTTAIDNGFSPSDRLLDSPIVLTVGGEEWRPDNFDMTFKGEMTIRDGLRASRNLIAIKLMMDPLVTPRQVADYAHKMGITSYLNPVPSLAIGSSEVTMWEMVPAFSIFPNGGILKEPFFISKIVDRNGIVQYEKTKADQEEVLSEQTAYIMTNMLETVVDHGTGIGARLRGFRRPAGGKTGTTNGFTDNWFIGFIPQLTCGVWVGFDDKTKIGTTRGEVGASTALPVWTAFMKAASDSLPVRGFPVPPGIYTATICLESGELALPECPKTVTDIFTDETLPKTECHLDHKSSRTAQENQKRFRMEDKKNDKKIRF
jgi:penicillin-binding protein 1A